MEDPGNHTMGVNLQDELAHDMLAQFNLMEVLDDDAAANQIVVLGR